MRFWLALPLLLACRSNPEEPAHPPQSDAEVAWVGAHTFEWSVGGDPNKPNPSVEYKLQIERSANGYLVHLQADGTQTMQRLVGHGAAGAGDKLVVSFDSCEPDDTLKCSQYRAGDVLFTLVKKQGVTKLEPEKLTTPDGKRTALTEKH